jgi:hypothetical protein
MTNPKTTKPSDPDSIDHLIDADSRAFDDYVEKREKDKRGLDSFLIVGRVCFGVFASIATYGAINGAWLHGFSWGTAIIAAIAAALWAMVIWWKSIGEFMFIPTMLSVVIVMGGAIDRVQKGFDKKSRLICGEHIEEPCDRY